GLARDGDTTDVGRVPGRWVGRGGEGAGQCSPGVEHQETVLRLRRGAGQLYDRQGAGQRGVAQNQELIGDPGATAVADLELERAGACLPVVAGRRPVRAGRLLRLKPVDKS